MGDLVFGWRTAVLTIAIAQLLIIANALSRTLANRAANRTLALLLLTLAGIVTPWAIGFAGFYDRWRWLTFAPLSITLAVAPLLWLYAASLVEGRWPSNGARHLLPAGGQLLFLSASFLLPLPLKLRWADVAIAPFGATCGAGTVVGLSLYGAASLRILKRYRARLAEERSDDARFALRWLSNSIAAALVLLPIWSIYVVWDALAPLGYRRLMGLHLAIAAFALYIAIEGWRHSSLRFPRPVDQAELAPPSRDWRALGERWSEETRANGWVADQELTVARLARLLGTNTSYLSRALNEGLGMSFSTFVNGVRTEAVAAALRDGDRRDVLDLAFEAGFSSKASFNRAFRAVHGQSPSAYRRGSNPK